MVGGIKREVAPDRANEGRDVRRVSLGNGTDALGRRLPHDAPTLPRFPARPRADHGQPWRRASARSAETDPKRLDYQHQIAQAQARWLELSSNARQIFTRHSSEYVQFDEPDAVVDAVREVHEQSRKSDRAPGAGFRDCPDCPEMVVIPAGRFTRGSPMEEKAWAVSHGALMIAVADEAPQHAVSLRPFALGKYDVTRAEYAAFVRATGRSAGDGCGHDGGKWEEAGRELAGPGLRPDRSRSGCLRRLARRAGVRCLAQRETAGVR